MTGTIRDLIMADIVSAVAACPVIRGTLDDQPNSAEEYETPPRPPRAEWGEPALPFAWVFELDEEIQPGSTSAYTNTLRVQVECAFNYGRDGALRFKPHGRHLLGEIEKAVMADLHRGGLAFDTLETGNVIEETPSEGIGVVVVNFNVRYFRNLRDPTSREARAIA